MIIIYKTTCLINNKIYIGQHRVKNLENLDDWYLGSGKIILQALQKYGKINFNREILLKTNDQNKANIFDKQV